MYRHTALDIDLRLHSGKKKRPGDIGSDASDSSNDSSHAK